MDRKWVSEKPRRRWFWICASLFLAMALTSCGDTARTEAGPSGSLSGAVDQGEPLDVAPQTQSQSEAEPEAAGGSARALIIPYETRKDRQGSVEVSITPLGEQSARSGRLLFQVAMNTHSVDLSMDLTELATFETDTGLSMTPVSWSGGSGHHVTGVLEFELPSGVEAVHLAQAEVWRVTLRNLDAALRVFEWSRKPAP